MSESTATPLPIVVGVSATTGSPAAVRWACAEAEQRRTTVLAVRAWRPTRPPSSTSGPPALYETDLAAERDRETERLRADVAAAFESEGAGEVPALLTSELVQGTALSVLQNLSVGASLVVLDAPRQTDLSTTPLLAHRIVYTAACPVVIMPPRVSGIGDSGVVSAGKRLATETGRALGQAGRPGLQPPPR